MQQYFMAHHSRNSWGGVNLRWPTICGQGCDPGMKLTSVDEQNSIRTLDWPVQSPECIAYSQALS